ncbi:CHAT domain-containing protein, partial [Mycena crocata]
MPTRNDIIVTMADDSDEEWITESESTDSHMSDALELKIQAAEKLIQQLPPGHPDHLNHSLLLGTMFRDKYAESEDVNDLEASLEKFQEAVNLSLEGHPKQAECLSTLALALTDRYQQFGELKDLEAALLNDQKAVELTPKDDPDRADRLQNLAISFTDRYHALHEFKDLEAALKKFQEAVDLTPADENDSKAARLEGLALSLRDRYQEREDITDLEAVVHTFREALSLDRYKSLGELEDVEAAVQADQEARLGQGTDLEMALEKFQEALNLILAEDTDRTEYLQDLAVCYGDKYRKLGEVEDLNTMIKKLHEALGSIPDEHPQRARCLQNLSAAFGDRYQRLGQLKDLETSLELDQKVVALNPEQSSMRASQLYQLAVSLRDRHQRLGKLKDLETALHTVEEAVNLTPDHHPDTARRLQTLAMSFRDRYQALGDLQDLENAIPKFQQAVKLTPEGHPERAGYLASLSIAFTDRYRRLGELNDLQAALQNDQDTLDLISQTDPDRARYMQNIAISLRERHARLGEIQDFEAAHVNFRDAVELTPLDHRDRAERLYNLSSSFRYRYITSKHSTDLEAALQWGEEAIELTPEGHPERAARLQHLAICYQDCYMQAEDPKYLEDIHALYKESFELPSLTPEDSWTAALQWASFANDFQPSDGVAAYTAAFRLLPDLLWIGHSIPTRHRALRRLDVGKVTSEAVCTCINLDAIASAIEIAEQGLATIFQQMLQLKTDVDKLPSAQAEVFRTLSIQLYEGNSEDQMDLAIRRDEMLKEIRQQPGLEYFLLPKPYDVLRYASQGGPVVILNSHEDFCDAVIMLNPASCPVHVPLLDITLDMLQSQRTALSDLLGHCNIRSRGESESSRLFGKRERFTSKPPEEGFGDLLAWLSTHVVAPIYQVLNSHGVHGGRLWWLPTGAFTGLPLHASSESDQFINSYTSTLGSLLDAYKKSSSAVPVPRFGIVGVTHSDSSGRGSLTGVQQEVEKILSIITEPREFVDGQKATVEAVKLQLETCSWFHLACHGKQQMGDPTKSYLTLYEGVLELDSILRMPLTNAEFVFLAACQTAKGDAALVNESFHLGGGFISAGFRSAVGTLWSMMDADGPLVSESFYSYLFRDGRRPQATDAAEALHHAVKKLKATKVAYERWIPFIHIGV